MTVADAVQPGDNVLEIPPPPAADDSLAPAADPLERARLRQANRIYQSARAGDHPTFEDLVRIEARDILQSSVFSDAPHDDES